MQRELRCLVFDDPHLCVCVNCVTLSMIYMHRTRGEIFAFIQDSFGVFTLLGSVEEVKNWEFLMDFFIYFFCVCVCFHLGYLG